MVEKELARRRRAFLANPSRFEVRSVDDEDYALPDPRPFDMAQLKPTFFITVNGSRGEGKSFLARDIVYRMLVFFARAEVFTGTDFNGFWQQYFPRNKVFDGYRPGVLRAIMSEQRIIVDRFHRKPQSINPWRLLVFDDVVGDAGCDALLEELATKGRHYFICVVFMTQHPQKISTTIRDNTDVCFVFRMLHDAAFECLVRNYLGGVNVTDGRRYIQRWVWKNDDTSQCLVFFNKGARMKDRLFVYHAADPGPFLVGSQDYWLGKGPFDDDIDEPEHFSDDELPGRPGDPDPDRVRDESHYLEAPGQEQGTARGPVFTRDEHRKV